MEPSFSVAILLSLFDFRFLFSLFINSSVGFFMELYVVLLCYIEGCQFACWELGAAFCHWDGRDWKWVEAGQPVSLLRCSLGAYPSLSPVAVSAALALVACHMPVSVPKGCLPVHTAITHLFPRTPHTCTQSLQVAYDFFFLKNLPPSPF